MKLQWLEVEYSNTCPTLSWLGTLYLGLMKQILTDWANSTDILSIRLWYRRRIDGKQTQVRSSEWRSLSLLCNQLLVRHIFIVLSVVKELTLCYT